MKLKTLFKCLSGLAICSSLIPVGMSFNNKTLSLSLSNQNVGNFQKNEKNDEVLADLTFEIPFYAQNRYAIISGCTNKDQTTKLVVPRYVSIGEYKNLEVLKAGQSFFANNKSIRTIEIKGSNWDFDDSFCSFCSNLKSITFSSEFLNSLDIDSTAFAFCSSLTDIYGLNMSLNNIKNRFRMPKGSPDYPFAADPNINIHYTVQKGDNFSEVLKQYAAKFDNTGARGYTFIESGDSFWDVINDGIISPKADATFPSDVVIPKTITNKNGVVIKVKGIADNAFEDNNQIQSISFPATDNDSSFSIGNNAFANCPNLRKITFASSNPDTFNIGNNVFVNCPNINNVEIQQDIEYASQSWINTLISKYREKLVAAGIRADATYLTWYDSHTVSPSESISFFNLNSIQIITNINNGFKAWKDENPNNRSVTLEYTTSDNSINVTGTLDVNLSSITTTITGNIPNIEAKDVTFTPKLHLRDNSSNAIDKTIELQPGIIHLSANDSFAPSGPVFSKNENLPATRLDGLWALKDLYQITAEINKAYFNEDWNNQENILNNLNKYFKFVNGDGNELDLNSLGNYQWFNNQLGIVEFTISSTTNATYNFLFKIYKGSGDNQTNYKDQNIDCFLRTKLENNKIFTIQTYSKYKFAPNVYFNGIKPDEVQLSLDNLTQNVVFGLSIQTEDSQLAKNAFQWYLKNGYSLSVDTSSFADDNISISNNITLNADYTELSFPINLTIPIVSKNLNIDNLSIIASKAGTQDIRIPLPQFSVFISNNNIHCDKEFKKNKAIDNNRNGLWISGDSYSINIDINKAYFGQNWNNPTEIKNNFDKFINVVGLTKYSFNHLQSNIYYNYQIGQMEVLINEVDNATYHLTLNFTLPDSTNYSLLTQTIHFYFNTLSTTFEAFNINTISGNELDPQYAELSNESSNVVNLNKDNNRQANAIYYAKNKTAFANIPANSFQWAKTKGYFFKLINNKNINPLIKIDDYANFDVQSNTLLVSVKQILATKQDQSFMVENLRLQIVDLNGNVYENVVLAPFKVNISASEQKAGFGKDVIYTTNTDDKTSLRNEYDNAQFNLSLSSVLLNNDKDLINLINVHFNYEAKVWKWKLVSFSQSFYKFVTTNLDHEYELIYYRNGSNNLDSDLNPLINFTFKLTQNFNNDKPSNIIFGLNTVSHPWIKIKTNESIAPIHVNPTIGELIVKYLPIILGSVGGIVALIVIVFLILRRRHYNSYIKHKYASLAKRNKSNKK